MPPLLETRPEPARRLGHWPVQLKLVRDARFSRMRISWLRPIAFPLLWRLPQGFSHGKALVVDARSWMTMNIHDKLTKISVPCHQERYVVRMEVPCCGGIGPG